MVNITAKNKSLRTAIAQAIVTVGTEETIRTILEKKVPKGDLFEMAKVAGLFAVKKTADMIPDCHPLPIEYTAIDYAVNGLEIVIKIEVRTIYRTGVEVEAMHGASVVALTMYDMLKPIDKNVQINSIKLLEKHGGKSDWKSKIPQNLSATVVVCSDTISKGLKEDKAGLAIIEKLKQCNVSISRYLVVPDEIQAIQNVLREETAKKTDLLIYTGGTGLSLRDVTPEAIRPLLDREIPGIEEAMRSYGQERTALSMLSRSVAGVKDNTCVLALPGSTKGASESTDALFPGLLHLFSIFKGKPH